jgi:hypothetical protein
MFTLLPNGSTQTDPQKPVLRFSVFVSPRLDPSQLTPSEWKLGRFDDLKNWPSTLQKLAFTVNFSNGGPTNLQAARVEPLDNTPVLVPDLWDELFPASTYVNPYVYDSYRESDFLSYPVKDVHDSIKKIYMDVAMSSPQTFPSLEALGKIGLGNIGFYLPPGLSNVPSTAMPYAPGVRESDVAHKILSIRRLAGTKSNRLRVIDYISKTYTEATVPDIHGQPVPAKELIAFELFKEYYQSLKPDNIIPDSTKENPNQGDFTVPMMDFHREISSLSQYTGTRDSPGLMRRLGLVFDLDVQLTTTQLQSIQDTGTVSLSVKTQAPPSLSLPAVTPQTAYMIDRTKTPAIFVVRPNPNNSNSDLGSGMLLLGNSNFSIIQLDVDAGAHKVPQAADILLRLLYSPRVTTDSPSSLSLPSLNSGGISVVRTNRALALKQHVSIAEDNNHSLFSASGSASPSGVVLYAEDLTRGYRVDIWNAAANSWLSLCKRTGTFTLPGRTNLKTTVTDALKQLSSTNDEGWISTSAQPKPAIHVGVPFEITIPPYLSINESMFRWNGWSLCAPRPPSIQRISQDNAKNEENVGTYDPDAAHNDSNKAWNSQNPPFEVPLQVSFALPTDSSGSIVGTLPTLRFGNVYRMRARAVDLAGNSLDVTDPSIADVTSSSSPDWVTPEIAYHRFEPVQAPTIVLRRPLNPAYPISVKSVNGSHDYSLTNPLLLPSQVSPGEHLDRLVIRSNWDKSASVYNEDLNKLHGLKLSPFQFLESSDRNIAPPRTSEATAELHGVLDDPATHKPSLKLYSEIVSRDLWKFDEYRTAAPPSTKPLTYAAQLQITKPDDMDVHYLTDPISQGAALLFLDIDGKTVLNPNGDPYLVPFYGGAAWPNLQLFTLELVEGSSFSYGYKLPGKIQISAHPTGLPPPGGVLWVALPKGTWVDVQLSSYLSPADATPEKMGILGWIKDSKATQLNDDINLTKKGQFWMITPPRKLRLVHAVQQPVNGPSLSLDAPEKESGKTYVKLSGQIGFHGSSTAKLDVLAAWEDPIDNPGPDLHRPAPVQDGRPWTTSPAVHHSQHVFQLSQLDPSWTSLKFNDRQANPQIPANYFLGDPLAIRGTPPYFPLPLSQKHEFGDTKRRLVRYTVLATTRYLEYLPDQTLDAKGIAGKNQAPDANGMPSRIVRYANDITDNASWTFSDMLGHAQTFLDIPSSARPAKPRVLYAVPTFAWDRGAPLTSTRKGNGLRVYMERPWYSSGFGELLGVVLARQGTDPFAVPNNLKLLVTQWGQDPLWAGSQIGNLPSPGDFVGTTTAKNPDGTAISPATVVLAELDETAKNNETAIDNDDDDVIVVPYDVVFDDKRNLWYADIQLNPPGDVYFPFIRLALVRYQPNSVFPNHISPVVLTDYMQLTPDRELTVTQKDSLTLTVMLKGAFPQGTPTAVQVTLQEQSPSVLDPDLGWSKVVFDQTPQPNPTWLTPYTVQPMGGASEVIGFSGDIKLLKPRGTPGYRLLVTEYEKYNIDTDRPIQNRKTDPVLEPRIVVSVADKPLTLPVGLRLVYAEAVSLE